MNDKELQEKNNAFWTHQSGLVREIEDLSLAGLRDIVPEGELWRK